MLAAVLTRVILALALWSTRGEAAFLAPDSPSYLRPATALATRLAFDLGEGHPELFRTPGYPLLLAAGVVSGHPIAFAIAVQTLLSALLVWLTFRIALHHRSTTSNALPAHLLASERIAAGCAWVVALEPTLLMWSLKVMTETLLTLFLVAFAAAALRALETRRPGWTIAAAAALCCAAYVKPIAYPLVIVLAVAALFKVGVRHASLFLLTSVVLLAPWHLRNARHGYRGFSTLADQAMYAGVGGSVAARQQQVPYAQMRVEMFQRLDEEKTVERYTTMRREGWRLMLSDPLGYAWTHVQGMARTLFDPGAVEYLRAFGRYPESGGGLAHLVDRGLLRGSLELARAQPLAVWSSIATALILLPLIVLPGVAAMRLTPQRRSAFVLFAIITAWLVFAGGGVPGSSRFRAPAIPFLALMSGFAFRPRC